MTAIKVPPLGESIIEATVSRWLKNEGDPVAVGETLVELDTDKITVEVPAMMAGVLTKRAHAEGDVVKVDDLLAEIDENAAPAAGSPAPRCSAKGACATGRRSGESAEAGACPAAPLLRRHHEQRTYAFRRPPSAWRPSEASTSRRFRAPAAAESSASRT